jgi:POT family proton-dependent oligopeptide transporter
MGIGYLCLAISGMGCFLYCNGSDHSWKRFFQTEHITTILGSLYSEGSYKPLKDSGYNIFYMGINLGAFICNFFAAFLRNSYGWSEAFAAAGIGMFIGVGAIFIIGKQTLQTCRYY